jgi:hypothetical protein
MQINISDRGAILLAIVGGIGATVVFAPDMASDALRSASEVLG